MKSLLEKLALLFVSFVLAALLFISFADAKIDPEAVVAIWLLDEGKGVEIQDSSGNDYTGNIQGGVKWVEGKFNEAIDFSGGASITIPDNEAFNFGDDGSFTVVMWFNFSQSPDWSRLLRERNPGPWGAGNPGWEIQTEGVQIHWSLDDAQGNHQKTTYPDVGGGEWHHTAMIVDRDKKIMTSYMDGAGEKTVNIANIGSVADVLPITFAGGYPGLIDDVAIFNDVLELDDVVDIMNKGLSEAIMPEAVNPAAKLGITWGQVKDSK